MSNKVNQNYEEDRTTNAPYSDSDPIRRMMLPQANGGVASKVTSHCTGNSGRMEGERDLGNYSGRGEK